MYKVENIASLIVIKPVEVYIMISQMWTCISINVWKMCMNHFDLIWILKGIKLEMRLHVHVYNFEQFKCCIYYNAVSWCFVVQNWKCCQCFTTILVNKQS